MGEVLALPAATEFCSQLCQLLAGSPGAKDLNCLSVLWSAEEAVTVGLLERRNQRESSWRGVGSAPHTQASRLVLIPTLLPSEAVLSFVP